MKRKVHYGEEDAILNALIIFMAIVALASFALIVIAK